LIRDEGQTTYRGDDFLAKATVSPKKRIAILSFLSKLLPHWFDGASEIVYLCLSFLFLIEQFITLRSESIENILLEADFLWSIVVIIEDQSVKVGLRVEVMKGDGGD